MFVEITKKVYEELKPSLIQMNVNYEVSDCTLPQDSVAMVHLRFTGILSNAEIEKINKQIDYIYGEATTEQVLKKDLDGNGIADVLENSSKVTEVRRRKWDDKVHTPGQEFAGYFTGANQEEEVFYESK